MRKFILLMAVMTVLSVFGANADNKRYVGGDISLLSEYEKAGSVYKDNSGKPIAELFPWLHEQGMNAMRVRLFVDPSAYTGSDKDPNACQDLDYITPLCRRIKEAGFALMLDFHYSDTWADPAKQWTPKAWEGLTDNELIAKIHDYTAASLRHLVEAGATPDFIQTGNEISYGMLWGPHDAPSADLKKTLVGSNANWGRLARLLISAGNACREVCPDAKIIIHTERVVQPDVLDNFYSMMKKLGVSYDIIGLSYYPYFHGDLDVLSTALDRLTANYPDKPIMIVETGYPYKWEVPGTDHDVTEKYPYSEAGQDKFVSDLISLLREYDNVTGLFWWWLEYNAFGSKLSNWYNAPLFDSTTGRATKALTTLFSFADGSGITLPVADNREGETRWFDLAGREIPAPTVPGCYLLRSGESSRVVIVGR